MLSFIHTFSEKKLNFEIEVKKTLQQYCFVQFFSKQDTRYVWE